MLVSSFPSVSGYKDLLITLSGILFHTIPRDTKDNRHIGHVGVSNKIDNQNSFVKGELYTKIDFASFEHLGIVEQLYEVF